MSCLRFPNGGLRRLERCLLPFQLGLQACDLSARCVNPRPTFAPLHNETATHLYECSAEVGRFPLASLEIPAGAPHQAWQYTAASCWSIPRSVAVERCSLSGLGMLLVFELLDVLSRGYMAGANGLAVRSELSRFRLCIRGMFEGVLGFAEKRVQGVTKRANGRRSFGRDGILDASRSSYSNRSRRSSAL